jgi:methanogenic corrinoid protein MtbC1
MAAEQIFKRLSDAVVEMEEELAVETAHEALAQGVDAYDAIEKGLSDGMARAGRLFEEEEYFIPELLMCSYAMYAGLDILKPHLKRSGESRGKATMDGMGQVVKLLHEENIRDGFKVMVGGGPISPGFANRIGADGYAVNAAEAVKVARELVGLQGTA